MDKNVEHQRFRWKHKMWKSNLCIISPCHPLILPFESLCLGGLLSESSLAATHMMQVCYYLVRMERWEWTFRYTTMALRWNWNLCRWRASNFDLCSALMAIVQWGFFSVPHLLWHGASVYNGHLRWPMILTPIAERLAVELSLPVFTTWSVAAGMRTPNRPFARRTL